MSLIPTNEDNARAEGEQQGFKRGYQSATVDAKRNDQFNGLSPAEHERLTILFEEMAESIQVVGKTLRHGYPSYNPFDPTKETNRSLLETELGHVMYAISALIDAKELEAYKIHDSQKKKAKTIQRYLHHQDPGAPAWSQSNGDVRTLPAPVLVPLSRFDQALAGPQMRWDENHKFIWRNTDFKGNPSPASYRVCTKCNHSDVYLNHANGGHSSKCTVKS